MNKVIMNPRLVADPSVTYTQGAEPMCIARFNGAVDRRFSRNNEQQSADFPSFVAFGKTAEWIEKYCRKGVKYNIIGRIQTGSYTNKDGNKVYTTDVVIEEIEFAEKKADAGQNVAPSQSQPQAEPKQASMDDFMTLTDSELEQLPFN